MSEDNCKSKSLISVQDIPDGGAREVTIDGEPPRYLVLIRQGEAVFAYHNVCPHAGRPLNYAPDQFLFTPDGNLVCTAHGATFAPDSGECLMGPCLGASLAAIPVQVRAGEVFLDQA